MFVEKIEGNNVYFSESNWGSDSIEVKKMSISDFMGDKRQVSWYIYK